MYDRHVAEINAENVAQDSAVVVPAAEEVDELLAATAETPKGGGCETYGGLCKVEILFRADGLFDVLRVRRTGNGEIIKGCVDLEDAFDAIRAVACLKK